MKRRDVILGGAAVLGLGGWYLTTGGAPGATPVNPFASAAEAQTAEDVDISTIRDMTLGDENAPVTVIEYASYTCPHCASFHATTFKQIKADFIDTGKVRYISREVYFDRYGLWASMVARCQPEKFFGVSDLLYSSQSVWTRAGEPAAIVKELRKIGRMAGLQEAELDACLGDGDKARTLVAWWEANGKEHNITSTPSIVINDKTYQNMAYGDLKKLIEEAAED